MARSLPKERLQRRKNRNTWPESFQDKRSMGPGDGSSHPRSWPQAFLRGDGIVINSFMLEANYYLMDLADKMTRINRDRAFYTTPSNLERSIMVDYLRN